MGNNQKTAKKAVTKTDKDKGPRYAQREANTISASELIKTLVKGKK